MKFLDYDRVEIELNEYSNTLKDVKPHIDEACEKLEVRTIVLKISGPVSKAALSLILKIWTEW